LLAENNAHEVELVIMAMALSQAEIELQANNSENNGITARNCSSLFVNTAVDQS
jgi:vacuolar-type H+-ATPase subunit B/Vma2